MMNFKHFPHPPECFYKSNSTALTPSDDVFATIKPNFDHTPENVQKLKAALNHVSANCDRNAWLKVIFAINSLGWNDVGKQVAREWSLTAPDLFTEDHFNRDWASAKDDKSGGITINTLFDMAIKKGWSDPKVKDIYDDYGDIANGVRFANKFRGQFLYCYKSKTWYSWDGFRWAICEGDEALQAAKVIAEEALNDAFNAYKLDDGGVNAKNLTQAKSVHRNVKRLEAMLQMAASEHEMSIFSPASFDANPLYIATRNGVIDLKTGALLQPNPKMRCSRLVAAAYDRGAKCPMWLDFLQKIFNDNDEIISYIQRALGYSLTGLVNEEKLFFMYGLGANGKSVFANIVNGVFGEYAVTVGIELLTKNKNEGEANRHKARLAGARLASTNETGANDFLDDARVKEITSREAISVRQLYCEAYEITPTHKTWVRGNHKPSVQDSSDGLWRRIDLIHLKRQFSENERVTNLDQVILESERDGVLTWMVEGCLEWQKFGLKTPEAIKAETNNYRKETDFIEMWLDDNCIRSVHTKDFLSSLFNDYKNYLNRMDIKGPTQIKFSKELESKGFERAKISKMIHRGLRLNLFDGDL
jgi:P4 family phage/plasmid primase-like protien